MQYARNGRHGLLQEGGSDRKAHARGFDCAFVLRSLLFAKWNHWCE